MRIREGKIVRDTKTKIPSLVYQNFNSTAHFCSELHLGNFKALGGQPKSELTFKLEFSFPHSHTPKSHKVKALEIQIPILSTLYSSVSSTTVNICTNLYFKKIPRIESSEQSYCSRWVSPWWVLRDVKFWSEILTRRLWSYSCSMKKRSRWCSSSPNLAVTLRELYLVSMKRLSLKRGQVPSRCFHFPHTFWILYLFLLKPHDYFNLLFILWYVNYKCLYLVNISMRTKCPDPWDSQETTVIVCFSTWDLLGFWSYGTEIMLRVLTYFSLFCWAVIVLLFPFPHFFDCGVQWSILTIGAVLVKI